MDGLHCTWSPPLYLDDPSVLNPVSSPSDTITYRLFAYDNRGCPKPGTDDVTVFVRPKIHPFAGRDTSVIIDQPLQFAASGGSIYEWSPPTGLSATNIHNPIGLYSEPSEGLKYLLKVSDESGCTEYASVTVKVFATGPTVFVPTAFTPDSDGKNDLLRPIATGMYSIAYFQVFNRWGQSVFNTNINGKGWDGTLNGRPQKADVYLWIVKAVDYKGNAYFQKGNSVLIR
jgi:gliding motility-associated-like protein